MRLPLWAAPIVARCIVCAHIPLVYTVLLVPRSAGTHVSLEIVTLQLAMSASCRYTRGSVLPIPLIDAGARGHHFFSGCECRGTRGKQCPSVVVVSSDSVVIRVVVVFLVVSEWSLGGP